MSQSQMYQPQPTSPPLSRLEALGNPQRLLSTPRSQLRGLWLEVQSEIRGAQMEVGLLTARLTRDKVMAWNKSQGLSVAARNQDCEIVTVDLNCALIEARTQLLALESERDMYAYALDMR